APNGSDPIRPSDGWALGFRMRMGTFGAFHPNGFPSDHPWISNGCYEAWEVTVGIGVRKAIDIFTPATLGPFESDVNEDRMLAVDVNIFTSTKVQGICEVKNIMMDWNIPVMPEPMLDF
ncbi:hypothetical protein K435DRAFT_814539, partial [Dendrothele bispora CBS 962.96]